MNVITTSRKVLIRSAKVLPFVLCAVICLSYCESVYALTNENFSIYNESYILDKPISFFIGSVYTYDWYAVAFLALLSISMETCVFNKLAVVYTGLNIIERNYFVTVELYPEYIYTICIINICACVWLCWNGLRRILKLSDAIS